MVLPVGLDELESLNDLGSLEELPCLGQLKGPDETEILDQVLLADFHGLGEKYCPQT